MAAQQFNVASTIPIGKLVMPLPQLSEQGVKVMTGTDSVIDHWSPFGTGSMPEVHASFHQGKLVYGGVQKA